MRYIDSDQALKDMVSRFDSVDVMAVDTEFMRTDTFFPIPALLQFSDGELVFLVDPLKISNWQPLRELLTRSDLTKLIHSVSEDFEVFQVLLQCVPSPLLDTQVGAGLAGMGHSMGYQKLVSEVLGVELDKGETRSNWLARPLSESQLRYAALDVEYLIPLYRKIIDQLEPKGRLAWWREEGQRQVNIAVTASPPEEYYKRIKTAWKLSRRELAVLKALCSWREQLAREQDVPRGRILKDAACQEIASKLIDQPARLAKIRDIKPSIIRRYGDTICELVVAVSSADDSSWPPALPKPPAGEEKERKLALRRRVERLADDEQIPKEMLLSKQDMRDIVRHGLAAVDIAEWKKSLVRPLLKEIGQE